MQAGETRPYGDKPADSYGICRARFEYNKSIPTSFNIRAPAYYA